MNLRLIIAFAVVLPTVIFGASKWATRWRPVVVGRAIGADIIVSASNRYIEVYDSEKGLASLLELNTGAQTRLDSSSDRISGDWVLSVETRVQPRLILRRDNQSSVYPVARLSGDSSGYYPIRAFNIAPERNCVQLLLGSRYYQWNFHSRQLQRDFQIPIILDAYCAFARDGELWFKQDVTPQPLFRRAMGAL